MAHIILYEPHSIAPLKTCSVVYHGSSGVDQAELRRPNTRMLKVSIGR